MSKALLRSVVALVVATGIALAVIYRDQFSAAALETWVNDFGAAGPVMFMFLYAIGTVLFLPGSVLTLGGGALFGPLWGTIYNLTGATLGATLAFVIARYLAADWAERHSGGRLGQIKKGVEEEGWRFVAFVRLVPLFPFNALNYALGLTRLRLGHYIVASYLCMLPGAVAYTYLGYTGREAVAGGEGLIQKGLLALALLALAAFLPRIVRRLRQASTAKVNTAELKQRLDRNEDLLVLDVRPAADYAGSLGHIPGSLNIPLNDLPGHLSELENRRDRPLAVICRTNRASGKAAALLRDSGFQYVFLVDDGMVGWQKHVSADSNMPPCHVSPAASRNPSPGKRHA
jgi:uncharacterized membrane protein YdjX (TVP38/TMEM64 family)/rhodanese-related sulfurtransferase